MTRFVDIEKPDNIMGYPATSSPVWSTTLVSAASGAESANQNWEHPKHRFRLAQAIRCQETFEALKDHWLVMAGPFRLWPYRDPLDFASIPLEESDLAPAIGASDQQLGTTAPGETEFQLIKTYTRGSLSFVRRIELPVVSSVVVSLDGTPVASDDIDTPWEVDREGGILRFLIEPDPGLIVRAGFLFDVPVRFETDNQLEGIVHAWRETSFADLVLLERKLC